MSETHDQILHLRKDNSQAQLDEMSALADPVLQFGQWMEEALSAEIKEPNAMALATQDADGRISNRIVLLRGYDASGFRFFTNYKSRKGSALAAQPFAALTFFWPELERQIRIEGTVEKTSAEESDTYYFSRPRGNRLGAWASPQSEEIAGREVLEGRMEQYQSHFDGQEVSRPEHWGGYRLSPDRIEFWQGRPSRLHDRILYKLEAGKWEKVRLAP